MSRRDAQVRRRLAELVDAAQGADRYQDLLLHLRAVRADFPAAVPLDHEFRAGGIEWVTCAAGTTGVPVRSLTRGESAQVADRTPIEGGGELRAEVLLAAGGVWDRHRRCWATDRQAQPHALDLVESQHAITRDFAAWLGRYRRRRERPPAGEVRDILNVLAYGDRGSGKTWISLLLLVAGMLEIPDSVGWVVVENRPASTEDVHETLARLIPDSWWRYQGQPAYVWRLVNGSRLYEKSADEPAALKAGRVDLVLINEAAKMPAEVYAYGTQRVKDRGGLVLLATNPPTLDKPRGVWVHRLWELEREHRARSEWCEVVSYHLDSALNATLDRGANVGLKKLLRAIAPQLASADADGLMVLPGERIIKTFDVIKHGLRAQPEIGDITTEFLRRHPRVRRPFGFVAGVDFQGTGPGIVATFYKIYGTLQRPVLWAVSDVAMRVDEETFLDELLADGITVGDTEAVEIEPSTCLFVGDSSAQWQDSVHSAKAPPSFVPFLNRGLVIVSPTLPATAQAKWGRNPPVGRSLGLVNRWFADDRAFVSPRAKMLLTACKEGRAEDTPRGIRPDRASSHSLDTLRYPLWFIEPPMKRVRPAGTERRETCYAVE